MKDELMKDERARLSKIVRPLILLDWRHGPPSRFGRSIAPIGRSRQRDGIKVELRAHPTLLLYGTLLLATTAGAGGKGRSGTV
jgi:hypothetical protein